MKWNVQYSAAAMGDLKKTYEYIAGALFAPDTAADLVRAIMDAVRSLEEMPMRYRLCENEPWRSGGLRKMPVRNYVVYYLPDETTDTVSIVRILYGGMDPEKQLSELPGAD